jgi:hypothetical protein
MKRALSRNAVMALDAVRSRAQAEREAMCAALRQHTVFTFTSDQFWPSRRASKMEKHEDQPVDVCPFLFSLVFLTCMVVNRMW